MHMYTPNRIPFLKKPMWINEKLQTRIWSKCLYAADLVSFWDSEHISLKDTAEKLNRNSREMYVWSS